MSELFRSFIVIFVLSWVTFGVIKYSLPPFLPEREFRKWRFLWLAVLFAAFVAHSIWVLIGIVTVLCFILVPPKPKDRVIYYLLLVCALPQFTVEIPGFAGIRYIFTLSYTRFLALILLFGIVMKSPPKRLFSFKSDKYVVLYVLLLCYLTFRDNTFTNGLRESLMKVMDIFVPYFVLSRYLDSKDQLNKAIIALLICMAPFALIGTFEFLKHWHIYNALKHTSLSGKINLYDTREGALRASAIFASPIVLGYVMVIGFGLLLYLQPLIANQRYVKMSGFALLAALLATMARGPWVGFVCLCFAYMWTGRGGIKKIILWTASGAALLPLLSLTPVGDKFVQLLPFIGNSASGTIDYRRRLLEQAWIVFKRHPLLGSTTFLDTPEMESMRQGQGIIDLVNTFVAIVLPYGIVGLGLFGAIFLGLLSRCYFILKRIPASEIDLLRMGRLFFAILSSILLMISTVSPIDYISVFYWTFAGIIAAYLHVAENTIKEHRANLNLSTIHINS